MLDRRRPSNKVGNRALKPHVRSSGRYRSRRTEPQTDDEKVSYKRSPTGVISSAKRRGLIAGLRHLAVTQVGVRVKGCAPPSLARRG